MYSLLITWVIVCMFKKMIYKETFDIFYASTSLFEVNHWDDQRYRSHIGTNILKRSSSKWCKGNLLTAELKQAKSLEKIFPFCFVLTLIQNWDKFLTFKWQCPMTVVQYLDACMMSHIEINADCDTSLKKASKSKRRLFSKKPKKPNVYDSC